MTKAKADRELVRPSGLMDQRTLRLHIQARHPRLRFWSRGEHDADHETFYKQLDHDHPSIMPHEEENNG